MEEWKVIGEAMKLLRDAFSLKEPQPVARFENDTDYEIFLGALMGGIEGIAELIQSKDPKLYSKILDAVERVSYK
jgi:hypothetical protein|tara:strand:- start:13934 stop:14158 length:225 start_codon:yes stop_codon:yes gene_type:complete